MVLAYQDYYTLEDYLSWAGDWELMDGMPYANFEFEDYAFIVDFGLVWR